MKVIEKNTDRLVLRSNPYGQIAFGLIFVLAAFAFAYFLGRSVAIRCQRAGAAIDCQLDEKLLGVTSVRQRTIGGIQRAEIDEHHSSDGGYTYQVILVTGSGRVPLMGYSSSGYGEKEETARQINDFIQGGRQDVLEFDVPVNWIVLVFLFVFGGVGLAMIVLAKTVQIEMLRTEGVLRIHKDGLFGGSQQEYLLREIQDVVLQSHVSRSRRSRRSGRTYRIAFLTTSDEEVPLSSVYTSGIGDKQRAVDAMKEFLAPYSGRRNNNPYS
ncbi:MAG: hypothetical protein ACOYYS_16345 [Chloroflexota bacterium]